MIAIERILGTNARTRYDEHGDPLLFTSERVLLAVRRMEWASAWEIFEALGLSKIERNSGQKALDRYVRAGAVLRRGDRACAFTYRLNEDAFPAAARHPCRRCPAAALPGSQSCARHLAYDKQRGATMRQGKRDRREARAA